MKKHLLLCTFLAAALLSSAQGDSMVYESPVLEEQAEYPGGTSELLKYLQTNINYPEGARERGAQGKCFISFVIEKDGSFSDFKVVKGVSECPECDAEAIRVLKMMPNWIPGKMNGRAVRSKFIIPIKFSLGGKTPTPEIKDMPSFPGGEGAMQEYLKKNMIYPKKALKKKLQGFVNVTFEVDLLGNISSPKVHFSTDPVFHEEALRLVKEMPKWTPGQDQKAGKPVSIFIGFHLPAK